jgi:hypothetical protein
LESVLGAQPDAEPVLVEQVHLLGGDGLLEALVQVLRGAERGLLEQLAQDDHVGGSLDAGLLRDLGCGKVDDLDVAPGDLLGDDRAVDDDESAGDHVVLELLEGRQVHGDQYVGLGDQRGPDGVVGQADAAVGGSAAHLGAVGREPGDLHALHQAGIRDDLPGEQDTLSPESGEQDVVSGHSSPSSPTSL